MEAVFILSSDNNNSENRNRNWTRVKSGWRKLNFYWIFGTEKKGDFCEKYWILWTSVTQRDFVMKIKWFTHSVHVYCKFLVSKCPSFNSNDSAWACLVEHTLFWFWFYIHFEWQSCRNQWNGIIRLLIYWEYPPAVTVAVEAAIMSQKVK